MSKPEVSAASVTMLIVIGSAIIFTTIIGLFICTCYRSSLSTRPRLRRRNQVTPNENPPDSEHGRHRKHLVYHVEDGSPLCGIGNIFGRRSLVRGNSLPDSIVISPSRPTMFGDATDIELSVQVVLTPPTPSKTELPSSAVDDEEDDINEVPYSNADDTHPSSSSSPIDRHVL